MYPSVPCCAGVGQRADVGERGAVTFVGDQLNDLRIAPEIGCRDVPTAGPLGAHHDLATRPMGLLFHMKPAPFAPPGPSAAARIPRRPAVAAPSPRHVAAPERRPGRGPGAQAIHGPTPSSGGIRSCRDTAGRCRARWPRCWCHRPWNRRRRGAGGGGPARLHRCRRSRSDRPLGRRSTPWWPC